MMASTQVIVVPEDYRCYHCGSESSDTAFRYFDNKKADQPRYRCHHCRQFLTLGSPGRPHGKTYAKKRNEDPAKLKSLSRQCCHCGVADHALFKYYNNNHLSRPRFKRKGCGKQFQMRLLGTGDERHLVHTASQRIRAPRHLKQRALAPFANASSNSEGASYQPFDGSFWPVPSDAEMMPLESGARLLPEMSDEDSQYVDFLEAELTKEENTQADPVSWIPIRDYGNLPIYGNLPSPKLSGEGAGYLHFLEAGLSTEENNETPNVDMLISSMANVVLDGELPPTWRCNEDAQFMDFIEAGLMLPDVDMISDHMAKMVLESTSSNVEVMYETLVVDRPAASHSNVNYADVAAACCHEMDMEMSRKNSMPVEAIGSESSSSSFGSTVIPESLLVQQVLTEDDEAEYDSDTSSSWPY